MISVPEKRGDLIEQAGPGADPIVLNARAEPGQLEPVQRLRAGQRHQGQAQGDLERGRGREPGPTRDVSVDVQCGATQRDSRPAKLGDRAPYE